MTDSRFSELVGQRMYRHCGKTVGVNLYRHSRITHERHGDKSLSEKAILASKMGHSVNTQENYRKLL
jgi:hypothetical protein